MNYAPFDSKNNFSEVLDEIRRRCVAKKIEFTHTADEIRKTSLIGDGPRLNRVLLKMLENAVECTPEGGKLTFSITAPDENDEFLKCHFTVSNTGTEMPEDEINRLYVKMMGGEIKAESMPNEGSKFHFDLRFRKELEIGGQQTAMELSDLFGKRILLVDDRKNDRMTVNEFLMPIGLESDEAENGKQAVDMFGKSPPGYYELIFMNLRMPVMGGSEAARKIRLLDHPDSKLIPIIAMTANACKEDIEETLASGMNGLIPKPIDINSVINALIKYMGSADLRADSNPKN